MHESNRICHSWRGCLARSYKDYLFREARPKLFFPYSIHFSLYEISSCFLLCYNLIKHETITAIVENGQGILFPLKTRHEYSDDDKNTYNSIASVYHLYSPCFSYLYRL